MSTELALPTTSNDQEWDDETRALMASAGLVHRDYDGTTTTAPRSVVASFLHQCARTQLDPHARQIYLIARKNQGELVWTTQVSIDGFRLIAERSGHYAGQGDTEWLTEDGKWVDVWLPKYADHPAGARATVYRDDFAAPLRAIALWDSYAQKKRNGELTSMWKQHGPLMIAKCAEALALRKAFPQDLSSLYAAEEMDQADVGADGVPSVTSVRGPAKGKPAITDAPSRSVPDASRPGRAAQPSPAGSGPGEVIPGYNAPDPRDADKHAVADEWADRARRALTVTDARDLYRDAKHRGILDYPLSTGELLEDVLRARGEHLAAEETHTESAPESDDYSSEPAF